MGHVFLFSYAHKDREAIDDDGVPYLDKFFEDLCGYIARNTEWSARDPEISFRDRQGIPLMDSWRDVLVNALQSSAVLVCATSPKYFNSEMCAKEYCFFHQRRRFATRASQRPPRVILPVKWIPADNEVPSVADQVQWKNGDMPDRYQTKGLLHLQEFARAEYKACVHAFAEAILKARREVPPIPPLDPQPKFEEIPTFKDFDPDGPPGLGPDVANFIYVAARQDEMTNPQGSYGGASAEWRPFLLSEKVAKTVAEMSMSVSEKCARTYREIPFGPQLADELKKARERKNLTVLIADARSLPLETYRSAKAYDNDLWEGSAVLVPWDETSHGQWEQNSNSIKDTFVRRSRATPPPFHAPVSSRFEFEQKLETTLTLLRSAVSNAEIARKKPDFPGPAQL